MQKYILCVLYEDNVSVVIVINENINARLYVLKIIH